MPLTHANLAASLANIRDTYELVPSDCSLLVMPLFHVHGLMAGVNPLSGAVGPGTFPSAILLSIHLSTPTIRPQCCLAFHNVDAPGMVLHAV